MRKSIFILISCLLLIILSVGATPTNSTILNTGRITYQESLKPGTPYKWSGVKVQYNYFYTNPSSSNQEWGWNEQSWWNVLVDRLHPSVFVYDTNGGWYNTGDGTKDQEKYATLRSWTRKLAEYAQRDNVQFIYILGNAHDSNIGINGLLTDVIDILTYTEPYPITWFGLDLEWTDPTATEDVASSLDLLNATISSRGSHFCLLYSVSPSWAIPFKNTYPVLAGTNSPAAQGSTRYPWSPFGLWEITLLDEYAKGFGIKCGLYYTGMENDWNSTIVTNAFSWSDQTDNLGVLAPNLSPELLNNVEFTSSWLEEASSRGYVLNTSFAPTDNVIPESVSVITLPLLMAVGSLIIWKWKTKSQFTKS